MVWFFRVFLHRISPPSCHVIHVLKCTCDSEHSCLTAWFIRAVSLLQTVYCMLIFSYLDIAYVRPSLSAAENVCQSLLSTACFCLICRGIYETQEPHQSRKVQFPVFLIHSCNNEATIRCCHFLKPSIAESDTVCIIQVICSEFIFYLELSGFMSL